MQTFILTLILTNSLCLAASACPALRSDGTQNILVDKKLFSQHFEMSFDFI